MYLLYKQKIIPSCSEFFRQNTSATILSKCAQSPTAATGPIAPSTCWSTSRWRTKRFATSCRRTRPILSSVPSKGTSRRSRKWKRAFASSATPNSLQRKIWRHIRYTQLEYTHVLQLEFKSHCPFELLDADVHLPAISLLQYICHMYVLSICHHKDEACIIGRSCERLFQNLLFFCE